MRIVVTGNRADCKQKISILESDAAPATLARACSWPAGGPVCRKSARRSNGRRRLLTVGVGRNVGGAASPGRREIAPQQMDHSKKSPRVLVVTQGMRLPSQGQGAVPLSAGEAFMGPGHKLLALSFQSPQQRQVGAAAATGRSLIILCTAHGTLHQASSR